MRNLVKQAIRDLWLAGKDEGLARVTAESWIIETCEQTDDNGYNLTTPTASLRLTPKAVDYDFELVLELLDDADLLAWLDCLHCQKYR